MRDQASLAATHEIDSRHGYAMLLMVLGSVAISFGGLIVRNLALIGAALLALVPAAERQLGPGDWLALLGSLIAGALLFSAANQLLANRAAINMWRKPK